MINQINQITHLNNLWILLIINYCYYYNYYYIFFLKKKLYNKFYNSPTYMEGNI